MRFQFLILALLFNVQIKAQNLIKNPKFDDYSTSLDSNSNIVYQPDFWRYNLKTPNHPIYYSAARVLNPSITNNFHPEADLVRSGQKINYISILLLPNTQRAYTELVEPLQAGRRYHLQVDVKVYDQSNCISDLIVGFKNSLDSNMDTCSYKLRLPFSNSINYDSLFLSWITLSSDFIAQGNEKVLIISAGSPQEYTGIIKSYKDKFIINRYNNKLTLKYFIDNVSLTPFESEIKRKEYVFYSKNLDSMKMGESLVLQNIFFDFDKYELLKESFPILDRVCKYLAKNEKIIVLISGNTDNIGNDEYNIELSNNRARAVVNYLIKKGISKDRLQYVGYGAKYPIDSNFTAQGRQRNRRIEMKIIM